MDLKAIKNWSPNNFNYPNFCGHSVSFPKRALRFFDIDIPDEKREFLFWIERFPNLQDVSPSERFRRELDAEIERRILEKVKNNPLIRELQRQESEIENLLH